jgi:hypothetical protein
LKKISQTHNKGFKAIEDSTTGFGLREFYQVAVSFQRKAFKCCSKRFE